MNPLYALKRWHYQRTQTPYVSRLENHQALLKRVARRRRAAQRREVLAQLIDQIRTVTAHWITTRGYSVLGLLCIYAAATAFTVFVTAQPVIDAQEAALTRARLERDEWRDVATRQATNEITVNLRGNASEVRKSAKRIAEDI
jgi:hypothetical protein